MSRTLPKFRRITIEVETSRFFDAAAKIDRVTLGDRFIEMCLDPDWRTQIALSVAYGIRVLDNQPADETAP